MDRHDAPRGFALESLLPFPAVNESESPAAVRTLFNVGDVKLNDLAKPRA
jgi:hypothetical protein